MQYGVYRAYDYDLVLENDGYPDYSVLWGGGLDIEAAATVTMHACSIYQNYACEVSWLTLPSASMCVCPMLERAVPLE